MTATTTAPDPQPAPLPPGARPDPSPHPRDAAVEAAAAELVAYVNNFVHRHGVTALELSYLLGVIFLRQVQALCLEERRQQDAARPPGAAP